MGELFMHAPHPRLWAWLWLDCCLLAVLQAGHIHLTMLTANLLGLRLLSVLRQLDCEEVRELIAQVMKENIVNCFLDISLRCLILPDFFKHQHEFMSPLHES